MKCGMYIKVQEEIWSIAAALYIYITFNYTGNELKIKLIAIKKNL